MLEIRLCGGGAVCGLHSMEGGKKQTGYWAFSRYTWSLRVGVFHFVMDNGPPQLWGESTSLAVAWEAEYRRSSLMEIF